MTIEALLEREGSVGASIIFAGNPYPCCGGEATSGKTLDIGGWKPNADATLVLRLAVFGGAPAPGLKDQVTYTSDPDAAPRQLRVESMKEFWGAVLVLACNDPSQGV